MKHLERYNRAVHAMQAGVKMDNNHGEHVQSRIGINVALVDHASLLRLLVAKGVITMDEYQEAIADGMEAEVRRYEQHLQGSSNVKITLVGRFGSIHDEDIAS